jgi:hypothetical protein
MSDFEHRVALRQSLSDYRGLNWQIFPCRSDKRPIPKNDFKAATTDADKHAQWWHQHPNAMIGIVTGPASGAKRPTMEKAKAWLKEHGQVLEQEI